MSVLDRKLARELVAARWLILAIILIIGVGVTCYVGMGSAYLNLTEAKARYYRRCRMADFWVELKKVPVAELDRLADLPGVAEIRPRIQFYSTVDVEGVEEPLNGLILSLPDRRRPIVNGVVIRRGSYFTGRRQNEVILNDAFARRHRLGPGQWVRLVLNNRRQELFIVGTAISSEFVYLLGPGSIVPDPEHFGVFYLKQSFAQEVFDFEGAANQVVGRLSPHARRRPREVLRRIEDRLAPYGVLHTAPLSDQPSNKYLSQEIAGLRSFGMIMPMIFLAVAALVLNVLLTRLAEQQRIVVGTLKALGYADSQVFGHFLKFGLAVGLAGGVLGCAGGYGTAEGMTYVYRFFFEFPRLENRFHSALQLSGLAISLLFAVLGSLRGAWSVLKLRPAEAMRPRPPKRGGRVFLERARWFWNRLSADWRMVLRDVVRSRVRTAAGVFAAMMGASVLVCGFMMMEATAYLVDFQFQWLLRSDLDVAFRHKRGEAALWEMRRMPGVDWAEPTLHVPCTFRHGPYEKKGAITGLAPGARLTVPRDRDANPIRVPPAGLAMSRTLAEILHLRRGDLLTIQPIEGLRRTRQVQVVQIADSYLGTIVYADIRWLSRLVGEELALTGVQTVIDPRPEKRRLLYRELKELPSLEAVTTRDDMVQSLKETLVATMWIFTGVFVAFAGIVFFGSVLNASLISLAERRREVATLRVLGYGPWRIGSLLLRESLIVTMIGTVLGMPVGYLYAELAAAAYESEMFRFPVVSSAGTWIWTLVLAVLFALAAYLVVQRNVHRMDWLEALQAKE
ncbi:MAG TPA: ABC transporter permease [Planctomycetaceae bacterium]|nr:ABC transporter permease [Planctomycetaceae bacterium]HIQ21342.1 ABC transporter permease [Planctomycetota bacterium]